MNELAYKTGELDHKKSRRNASVSHPDLEHLKMTERTADVLVIGTGIAGLRAASAAASLERKVTVVSE